MIFRQFSNLVVKTTREVCDLLQQKDGEWSWSENKNDFEGRVTSPGRQRLLFLISDDCDEKFRPTTSDTFIYHSRPPLSWSNMARTTPVTDDVFLGQCVLSSRSARDTTARIWTEQSADALDVAMLKFMWYEEHNFLPYDPSFSV